MRGNEGLGFLAEQAALGDEESFVSLCDALKEKLFRTARGILHDEALALDAVSEAVFRAYRGIKKLREPQYAETWFIRIVINVSNDIYRKNGREIPSAEISEEAQDDDFSDARFLELIDPLPLELREIVSLKYYSEYTLGEIATILKVPLGTVKSRLNRALKLLRIEEENE